MATLKGVSDNISSSSSTVLTYVKEMNTTLSGYSSLENVNTRLNFENVIRDVANLVNGKSITSNYLSLDSDEMPYGVKYYCPLSPTLVLTGTNKTHREYIDFRMLSISELAKHKIDRISYTFYTYNKSTTVGTYYFIDNNGVLYYITNSDSMNKPTIGKYASNKFVPYSIAFSVNNTIYFASKTDNTYKSFTSTGSDGTNCSYTIPTRLHDDLLNTSKSNIHYVQNGTNSFIYSKNNFINSCTLSGSSITINTFALNTNVSTGFAKTLRTSGSASCIEYGNGVWVVSGNNNGSLWYSTNGQSWTQGTVSYKNSDGTTSESMGSAYGNYYCLHYANGIWVAGYYSFSSGKGLFYSTDGKAWTQSDVTEKAFWSVDYGNGVWVAGSFNFTGFYYSTDGKSWTRSTTYTGVDLWFVYYANNMWIAGSSSYNSSIKGLFYSTDGKSWTKSDSFEYNFHCGYYGDGIWVAGSNSVGLVYSTDGKTWTQSNITSSHFYCVKYANGLWLAGGGDSNGIYYSTDGITWTQSNITSKTVYCLCYNENSGTWLAGTSGSGVYYSGDGKYWTTCGTISGAVWDIKCVDNMWVVPSNGGNGIYYCNEVIDTINSIYVSPTDSTKVEICVNNLCYRMPISNTTSNNITLYDESMLNIDNTNSIKLYYRSKDGSFYYTSKGIYQTDTAEMLKLVNSNITTPYLICNTDVLDVNNGTFIYKNKLYQRPHFAQYSFVMKSSYISSSNKTLTIDLGTAKFNNKTITYDIDLIPVEIFIVHRDYSNFMLCYRNQDYKYYIPYSVGNVDTNCIVVYDDQYTNTTRKFFTPNISKNTFNQSTGKLKISLPIECIDYLTDYTDEIDTSIDISTQIFDMYIRLVE
jgi:hypothetical protein